jgi:hypothetical protein
MNSPKYKEGDIIKLNSDNSVRREIVYVCVCYPYDEYMNKEICYYAKMIGDDSYQPVYIEESAIDRYYTKVINPKPNPNPRP